MRANLIPTTALASALCTVSFAAEETAPATAAEKTFIMKAANGGMTEVDLGKIAAQKGGSEEVKDFGNEMVKDHGKANENLKEVAEKMGVEVPAKVDAAHQAKIEKMSAMSAGAAFDKACVSEMISAHEKDIASFQAAEKTVKNEDLKEFIGETVPVMQHHLEMIKKFDQAKK